MKFMEEIISNIEDEKRYNVPSIRYLIVMFEAVVSQLGKNSNAVRYYRSTLEQMLEAGQIKTIDADMIETVIGMKNTDAVKWGIAEKKLSMRKIET